MVKISNSLRKKEKIFFFFQKIILTLPDLLAHGINVIHGLLPGRLLNTDGSLQVSFLALEEKKKYNNLKYLK